MKTLLLPFFAFLLITGCNKPIEMDEPSVFNDLANTTLKQQEKYYVPNYEYVFRSVVDKQKNKVVEIRLVYDEQGIATVSSNFVPMEEEDLVIFYTLNAEDDMLANAVQSTRNLEFEYRIIANKEKLWLIPFENPTCILFNKSDINILRDYTIYSSPKTYGETIATLLGYDRNLSCHACLSNEENKRNMSNILTSSDLVTGGALLIKAEGVIFKP